MRSHVHPFRRFFQFLGSVELAALLLVAGMAAMAAGTVIESRLDTSVAHSAVYRTVWFDLFLFLIMINLVMAVLNRLPLKRHQISFVITHAAIVLLLCGAWVSRTFGYEGQLVIREGESVRSLLLFEQEVVIEEEGGAFAAADLPGSVFIEDLDLLPESESRPSVRVLEYYHDGVLRSRLVAAPERGPGVEFCVSGREGNRHDWLLADDRQLHRKDLGPFVVEMLELRSAGDLERQLVARAPGAEVLIHLAGAPPVGIPLPGAVGRWIDCGGGTSARVRRFLERAQVVGDGVEENEGAPSNPAAVVELERDGQTESFTVFSRYPDFSIRKAEEGVAIAEKVRLEVAAVEAKPVVTLVSGPDGGLYLQQSDACGRHRALPVEAGGTVELEGLAHSLTVDGLWRGAGVVEEVRPAADGESGGPLARLEFGLAGETVGFWVEEGSQRAFGLRDRSFQAGLRRKALPIPFAVGLEDFQIEYYPASTREAFFASHVTLQTGGANSAPLRATISMNRPLDFEGFRLFQSSYILGLEGGPDTSLLSIARDPGVPLVYLSFIGLIFGVGWYMLGDGRKRAARS